MRNFALILLLCVASGAICAGGASASNDRGGLHERVAALLAELNSDRFEVRHAAAEEIEQLLAKPELGRGLAREFQQALVRTDISFEVRRQVERWSRRLPSPPAEAVADVSQREVEELVRSLDDESYAVRLGATRRVEWLLGNPKLICPIMLRLKRRVSDESLDIEARRRLDALWQRARAAWLSNEAADQGLPPVPDRQIDRWLNDLLRPGSGPGSGAEVAEGELLDLLARDDCLPRLQRAIRARLSQKPSGEAAAKLLSLLDWTKPELVAEYWLGRHEVGEQHLLIGVPTRSEGAARPTCFDRVNGEWAHCKSGNSLVPGDYRIGEAIPHPRREDAFFYFVSLPTPRRRMAYLAGGNVGEQKRLAVISRQTLDRVLADKRSLSEPELLMLDQLDSAEVSRFAGRYFLLVDDGGTARSGMRRLGGRPSRFGMICARLAVDGNKEAMPGLAEAIAKKRFLAPTLLAPYRLDWLAALSIAGRDPWPGVDDWLAGSSGDAKLLVEGHISGAQLGATAAAVLLKRHEQEPAAYGLLPVDEMLLERLHVSGYRFGGKEAIAKIQQWWREERERKKP